MAQIISTGQSLITANTKIKICHGYGCLFFSFRIFHCRKFTVDRILVIPTQGRSHMISTNSIGQELKARGHEVSTYC